MLILGSRFLKQHSHHIVIQVIRSIVIGQVKRVAPPNIFQNFFACSVLLLKTENRAFATMQIPRANFWHIIFGMNIKSVLRASGCIEGTFWNKGQPAMPGVKYPTLAATKPGQEYPKHPEWKNANSPVRQLKLCPAARKALYPRLHPQISTALAGLFFIVYTFGKHAVFSLNSSLLPRGFFSNSERAVRYSADRSKPISFTGAICWKATYSKQSKCNLLNFPGMLCSVVLWGGIVNNPARVSQG